MHDMRILLCTAICGRRTVSWGVIKDLGFRDMYQRGLHGILEYRDPGFGSPEVGTNPVCMRISDDMRRMVSSGSRSPGVYADDFVCKLSHPSKEALPLPFRAPPATARSAASLPSSVITGT